MVEVGNDVPFVRRMISCKLSVLEHVFDAHSDRIKFDGSAEQTLHQLVGGNLQFTYCFWNLFVF